MRVLVTRSRDDAMRTGQALRDRGHKAILAPLFEIRILDGPEPMLADVQAILATSGNGIRALARRSARRDLAVFAVGTRTAECARAEGFRQVVNAAGDAMALAAAVRARLRPDRGALLHATGTNSSRELGDALTAPGFEVRGCVLYEIIETPCLPDSASTALRERALDAVLLYSPRNADRFAARVMEAGLAVACRPIIACCISNRAADAVESLSFAGIRVAAHPDEHGILALLDPA